MDQKYRKAIIVFNGYPSTSTKSMTQERRTGGKVGATITFTDDIKLTMKKDHFLANKSNKQSFIHMVSRYLKQTNCHYYFTADADLLIVNKGVESSRTLNTMQVGNDTDLLILLLSCRVRSIRPFFFLTETKSKFH